MKLSILILLLVFINRNLAYNDKPNEKLYQELKSFGAKFIEEVETEGFILAEELNEQLNKITHKITSELNTLLLESISKLKVLPDISLEWSVDANLIPNEHSCKAKYEPSYELEFEKNKNSTELCLRISLNEMKEVRDKLQHYMNEIQNEITNLAAIYITRCTSSSNPVLVTGCMLENTIKLHKSIREISKIGRIATEVQSNQRVPHILKEAKQCFEKISKITEKHIQDLEADYISCIKESDE